MPLCETTPIRRLILASSSPYRAKLLRDAGYAVECVSPQVAEPPLENYADVETGLIHVAMLKAQAVLDAGAAGLILAADTVGVLPDGRVLGKPASRDAALDMLRAISGTAHAVLTGWCLLRSRDRLFLSGVERTTIRMRPWTDDEFQGYLNSGEWQGKSGAYGLQVPQDPFVVEMRGSAANVVGVPLERLEGVLREFELGG